MLLRLPHRCKNLSCRKLTFNKNLFCPKCALPIKPSSDKKWLTAA